MKPKTGGTGAKTESPKAPGTSYYDKLKGSGTAQGSGKGTQSGSYDGTKSKTYTSPSGEALSMRELRVKLPKLPTVTSEVKSLGKIRRRPGPKSKQKDLEPEVLDLGALANVSMSMLKRNCDSVCCQSSRTTGSS